MDLDPIYTVPQSRNLVGGDSAGNCVIRLKLLCLTSGAFKVSDSRRAFAYVALVAISRESTRFSLLDRVFLPFSPF